MPLVHLDEQGKKTFRRLLGYVFKYKAWFPLILLFLVIQVLADTALIQATDPLIEKVFIAKDAFWVKFIPLIMLVIFIFRGVATAGTTLFMGRLARNVIYDLRKDLFAKYMALPTTYYDKTNDAELTAKMTFHIEQVANASSKSLKVLIQDSLTIVAMLLVMLFASVKLFVFVLIIIPALAVVVRKVSYLFKRYSERILGSVSEINKITEEAVIGQKVIKSFSGKKTEKERFLLGNDKNRASNIKVFLTNAGSNLVIQIIAGIAIASILYFAVHYTDISTGKFMLFLGALLYVNTPLKRLLNVNETLQLGVASAGSIFAVLDQQSELDEGSELPGDNISSLRFKDVSFNYAGTEKNILSNVSFELSQGKMIALVGTSGSGKSSVASLVPRFYDVSSGSILLNGVDIREYKLAKYRDQIAYVSQDTFLFNDTIANNIAYPRSADSCMDQVLAAASAAHVLEFAENAEDGLDTVIGDRGVKLSGGQRQRIAIARAIMKNAPILILDEATSALDTELERLVQDELADLMKGRTSLVIAHRLSTIEMADEILVFKDGTIIERGTHAQLLNLKGQYYRLQQLQTEHIE